MSINVLDFLQFCRTFTPRDIALLLFEFKLWNVFVNVNTFALDIEN